MDRPQRVAVEFNVERVDISLRSAMLNLLVVPLLGFLDAVEPFVRSGVERVSWINHFFPLVVVPTVLFSHDIDPFSKTEFTGDHRQIAGTKETQRGISKCGMGLKSTKSLPS